MPAPVRAALYLRVSTGRQADSDLSIPDQRRQAKGYCASRGWEIVADYVEPGASATDDRRPEFERVIDAATAKPPACDVIVFHSFSRFFRDQFQLEFYVRRLARNGVRMASITQELGDDPMSNMIRQIMALFDEYQSKENAKHTLWAMKENARQGFWNGSLAPISASKLTRKRFASWEPRACSCVPSSLRRAQNRQCLECPVLYALPETGVTVHSGHMGYTIGPFARSARCPGKCVTPWTSA